MNKVIVVGAGIIGASTAYLLAKKGLDVTIVDRKEEGQATDAAAGIICPWLSQRRNKAWYHLAKSGARFYPALIEQLAEDGEKETGYARVGAINLHTDEKKLIAMQERAKKRREEAPEIGDITLLNPAETKKKFPLLTSEYASVHVTGAARVNGRKLRRALLNGAKKHGAILMEGNATLVHEGKTITGVNVDGDRIEAYTVVAATGAWMPGLLKPLGVELDIAPQRAQILHLRLPNIEPSSWPVVMPPTNQYMLPLDDGRIVVGATYENDVGFDCRRTAGGMYDILTKALTIAPELENASIVEMRTGFRPVAPEFLPIFGPLPNFTGLLLANGLGSTGLTMGPFIGEQLAKLVLQEELDVDLAHYDVQKAIRE